MKCPNCKEEMEYRQVKCHNCGYILNTSGMGEAATLPPELRGWSWGAFFLGIIWGIFNNSYLTLLLFIPFLNFIWWFVCGAKGNEWAWKNKKWNDINHFKRVQKKWALAGIILTALPVLILIIEFSIILY